MASEIRVDKITSLSGVGTITPSPTGIDIAGITTVATLKATTGIVTTLTATTGIVTTFEATTGNITTLRTPTGISTDFTADKITLPNSTNGSLNIGVSSAFKINHNGTDSFITEVGGGDLYIQGSDIIIRDAGTLDKYIEMTQNGAVDIYYDNSKKFETTTAGVTVTGSATVSGDVSIADKIVHTGDTDTAIRFPAADSVRIDTAGSNRFKIDSNGRIGILDPNLDNFDSSADDLVINGAANTGITINSGGTTSTSEGNLVFAEGNGSGGSADGFRGAVQYKHGDDRMSFYTDNAERIRIDSSGHVLPAANNTYNLGSTGTRWANIYTNDLQLSNKGKTNDVDGTWGDFTIQEGENDLFLINNRSGKKYKFNLTEVT